MGDYSKMSDDELRALETSLATKRTEIRLQQNAVAAEIEVRNLLNQLSPNARARVVKIELGGEMTPTGEASAQ